MFLEFLSLDYLPLIISTLVIVSVLASRASDRLGIPSLLFFLVIGMLAGADGPAHLYFDDARIARSIGVVALAYILFAGGLNSNGK